MINSLKCFALISVCSFFSSYYISARVPDSPVPNSPMDGCPQNIRLGELKEIIETAEKAPEISKYHYKVRWLNKNWTFLGPIEELRALLKEGKSILLGNRLERSTIKSIFKDTFKNKDGVKHDVLECKYSIYKYTYRQRNSEMPEHDEDENKIGEFNYMRTELEPTIPATTGK